MKMNSPLNLLILLSFLLSIGLVSCKKKPKADFLLKRYEYVAGDAIEYENYSEDYHTCKWEIMNSDSTILQEFEGVHPNLITGILSANGSYILRLKALSKKDKKMTISDRIFLIKTPEKNYLTINGSGQGDHDDYDVYVDNQFIGSSEYNGVFQRQIPEGYRIVKLVSNDETLENIYNFYYSVYITF